MLVYLCTAVHRLLTSLYSVLLVRTNEQTVCSLSTPAPVQQNVNVSVNLCSAFNALDALKQNVFRERRKVSSVEIRIWQVIAERVESCRTDHGKCAKPNQRSVNAQQTPRDVHAAQLTAFCDSRLCSHAHSPTGAHSNIIHVSVVLLLYLPQV